MTLIRTILLALSVCIISLKTNAQQTTFRDSIAGIVRKERNYAKQIGILQENIQAIYSTRFDQTISLARLGYDLAQDNNDPVNKAEFLRHIGKALLKKGSIDSASVYYYKALKEVEPTGNVEKLGLIYDDIARMYRKLKQPERALKFYEKALRLYEKENHLEGIARINNESGVVFRDDLGDYKTANERFEKSLRIQRQRNDSVGIGYALEFLGYNQMLIKEYKKSRDYFMQALAIREKLGDDFATMLNYTALGEFYQETNQPQKSNEYFEKSNAMARKIKFPDIQSYNYEKIMANHEALGDFKGAYHNLKAFRVLNDSLYNAEKLKNVEEITTRYETAEKENEILQQKAKITVKNFWIFGLVTLAVILGLIGFLLYKQQVLKNLRQQKDNELNLALEKIETQNKLQTQRVAISRDLHDNIGAQLSFIVSAVDTLKYYIPEKDNQVTHRLDHIGAFAKETIQELRDTIWAMNKSGITIADLQARIANFIEKARKSHQDIRISFATDPNIPADTSFTGFQGLNIFRIIQEATNNALKYAQAGTIDIQISRATDRFEFKVTDDGKGFVETEIEPGNGLLNMRKRALELGEELTLKATPESGTAISFSIKDKYTES